MAVSNNEIKRKELFKLNQKKIKLLGNLKLLQADMIVAINECAVAELWNYNKLKKGVIGVNMKQAVKRYTHAYMELKCLEKDILELQEWNTSGE